MELIARDVWLLSGYPRDWFNVYLVGDVLIDTATRWARRRIIRQLQDRTIRLVALSHCHPDHQGSARAICEHFNVPLACHDADVPVMEGRERMQPDHPMIRLGYRLWGGPAFAVKRRLRDGDELNGFRVIHAPGHTPGHCIFFRPDDRLAIAGDVLFNVSFLSGKPGLREPPAVFSTDPAQNRRSMRLLADLKPHLVCFGHGPPLREPLLLLDEFIARRERSLTPVVSTVSG